MALTNGFQLPFGIQPLNPVPTDAWSGPYEAATESLAILAANTSIPSGVRFKSLEVRLVINGVPKKYWYKNGILNSDLVEYTVDATNNYIDTNFLNLTGGIVTGETRINSNLIVETTSLSAALRITQTGTGNCLVVEDSTNPDSTPFVITQSGQVITGSTSVSSVRQTLTPGGTFFSRITPLFQNQGGGASSSNAIFRVSENRTPASIFLNKARGTFGTSISAIQIGDSLGKLSFTGHDGEDFTESSIIDAVVTDIPSVSSVKTDIRFSTANNGLSSLSEKVRFTADGNVGIGTSIPNERLTVSGSISASNKIYGTVFDWMTLVRGFKIEPTLNSSIGSGDVYTYVYSTSSTDKTYYRYIATDGSEDSFYEIFSGGILSNLIAKKQIII
jgi:hypothetical protein